MGISGEKGARYIYLNITLELYPQKVNPSSTFKPTGLLLFAYQVFAYSDLELMKWLTLDFSLGLSLGIFLEVLWLESELHCQGWISNPGWGNKIPQAERA